MEIDGGALVGLTAAGTTITLDEMTMSVDMTVAPLDREVM